MSFMHLGKRRMPYIPNLTIQDVWIGIMADYDKAIYKVAERGIWGGYYNMFRIYSTETNWCYTLADENETFPELRPVPLNAQKAPVFNGAVYWQSEDRSWSLYLAPDNRWILAHGQVGHIPSDDENYYLVTFQARISPMALAEPRGPWAVQEEPPANVHFGAWWAGWKLPQAWGTPKVDGVYQPVDGETGTVRVGVPSWTNGTETLFRTADPWNDRYAYKIEWVSGYSGYSIFVHGPNGWSGRWDPYGRYTMTFAEEPQPGSSFTADVVDNSTGEVVDTVTWYWNSWTEGKDEIRSILFEPARMF